MDSVPTMNIIIVLLFCIGVMISQTRGETDTPRQRYAKISRACQADPSTHLDRAELSRFDHGEDVHGPALGAHLLCLHLGMGLQDSQGNTTPGLADLLATLASEPDDADRLETLAEACGTRTTGTPEELAIALRRCINEYYPEFDFLHDP